MNATATIARSAGIAPRTKRFQLTDEYGFAYGGGRTENVLAALCRMHQLDTKTFTMILGIHKCYTTGRMNVHLARYLRESLSPYQVVKVRR